ncbi:MAG: hypothetical protein KKF44_01550 [Nanoarchaeota archaeon]|nr:hypothetical protein [Nanoarchaeota archaeon]
MARINYVCTKCKYKFSRSQETAFKLCPYCGAQGSIGVDTQDSASRILNEVSGYDRMGED